MLRKRPERGPQDLSARLRYTTVDTGIADVDRRSGNEPLDFLRRFTTKRATQCVPLGVFPRHGCSLSVVPEICVHRPGSCRTEQLTRMVEAEHWPRTGRICVCACVLKPTRREHWIAVNQP